MTAESKPKKEPESEVGKNDVIAELKMSKNLDGIKKKREQEKNKDEVRHSSVRIELIIGFIYLQIKERLADVSADFTVDNFVNTIQTVDSFGVPIPQWKRLMLAKKAAEKAKKEAQQALLEEHERRKMNSIPEWKRQLLNRKESQNNNNNDTSSTKLVLNRLDRITNLIAYHSFSELRIHQLR